MWNFADWGVRYDHGTFLELSGLAQNENCDAQAIANSRWFVNRDPDAATQRYGGNGRNERRVAPADGDRKLKGDGKGALERNANVVRANARMRSEGSQILIGSCIALNAMLCVGVMAVYRFAYARKHAYQALEFDQ